MSYNPSIPQPDDLISVSQGEIQTNFSELNTVFTQDHVEYDNATTADRGKHKQSTYTELVNPDEPTTVANESTIWAIEGPTSTQTELYMRRESQSGALSVPSKDLAIFGVAAAGLFDGAGAALGTHNVNMTVTKDETGVFTCDLTNPMPDTNYMVVICAQDTSLGIGPRLASWRINTKTVSSLQVVFTHRISQSTTLIDPDSWNVIIYGGIQ